MKLFLDTEFTGLGQPCLLISLALVSEDDRYFYAELSDGWSESDCTPWVQTHVLSKLDRRPEVTMTRAEAAGRLREFLAEFDRAEICYDSEYDERHLLGLLGHLPANATLMNIEKEVSKAVFDGYFGGAAASIQHHSLVDARALEYAFRVTQDMRRLEMIRRDDLA